MSEPEGNGQQAGSMWYFVFAGQRQGPVPEAKIRELINAGQVKAGTLVWTEGMAEWLPVESVPALASFAAEAAQAGVHTAPPTLPGPLVAGVPGPTNYAGFWLRAGALVVDSLIIGLVMFAVYCGFSGFVMVLGGTRGSTRFSGADVLITIGGCFLNLAPILLGWLYYAIFESSERQATLGKAMLGLRVTDLEGRRISFGRATGRFFGRILSNFILFIGFIMAAFTEKKQTLHDMIAGTLVLK
ncbi:MAG: RDD family protein [Planctomycetes bacterium]|nr:RDD family protein [Planctomycetota bacterium]